MRHRDIDSDDLSIALIIGAVALSYFGYAEFFPEGFIEKFQTMITGLIALGVGYASVRAIERQITATQSMKREETIERQISKTRTYAEAVTSYMAEYEWILGLRRREIPGGSDILIETLIKGLLPDAPPAIINDWYYISDLSAEDVQLISSIGKSVRAIYVSLSLTRRSQEYNGLIVDKVHWEGMDRVYHFAIGDIQKELKALTHNRH